MTTTGSVAFNPSTVQMMTRAARLVNQCSDYEDLGGTKLADYVWQANAMLKRWAKIPGAQCWATVEGTLFPVAGQYQYRAGTGATDHITQTFYQTAVTSDETLGQTAISIDSTSNIANGDFVGIVIDDGSIFWSTIAAVAGASVNIADPLPDSAAAGNAVFTYTAKITRPIEVIAARRYNVISTHETPIDLAARLDFREYPRKREAGSINTLFYDKQWPLGVFNIWQVPAAATELVNFTWRRPLEDFLVSQTAATGDFPPEWVDPVVWNLAAMYLPKATIDEASARRIEGNAAQFLFDVMGADRDHESVFFQPG